jgi:hypothetical protein
MATASVLSGASDTLTKSKSSTRLLPVPVPVPVPLPVAVPVPVHRSHCTATGSASGTGRAPASGCQWLCQYHWHCIPYYSTVTNLKPAAVSLNFSLRLSVGRASA